MSPFRGVSPLVLTFYRVFPQNTLDVTVTKHREELDDIMELVLAETGNADKQVSASLL